MSQAGGYLYVLPPLIGSILSFALGLFVYLRNTKSTTNKTFALLCLSMFVWLISYAIAYSVSEYSTAIIFCRIACTAVAFTAVFSYHFFIALLDIKEEVRYLKIAYATTGIFLLVFLFTNLFLNGVNHYFWGYYSKAGILHPLYLVIFYLIWARCFYLLYRFQSNKNIDVSRQNQARYLIVAFIIGLPSTIDYLPKYGFEFYPLGFIFVLLFLFITAFAIIKHNLLDARAVIKKTILYSVFLFIISVLYVVSIFIVYKLLMIFSNNSGSELSQQLIAVLAITILLKPLEIYIHKLLDKKFFKGSIEEISSQKDRLESELERSERLKSVGILAAGMAHEIKNPLTSIRTFAEYLPKKYQDEEFREKFSRILMDETDRISAIVRDLLLFSKPSEPVMAPCDIGKALRSITDLLRSDLVKRGIELEVDIAEALPQCSADESQLKQAFLNIIVNAIDAMKQSKSLKRLSVRAHDQGKDILVSIEDNGVGIPADKIEHIFDPFFTDKEGGTGLGLSITHSIIQKHQGKIEIESALGKGTKFIIAIPKL